MTEHQQQLVSYHRSIKIFGLLFLTQVGTGHSSTLVHSVYNYCAHYSCHVICIVSVIMTAQM